MMKACFTAAALLRRRAQELLAIHGHFRRLAYRTPPAHDFPQKLTYHAEILRFYRALVRFAEIS